MAVALGLAPLVAVACVAGGCDALAAIGGADAAESAAAAEAADTAESSGLAANQAAGNAARDKIASRFADSDIEQSFNTPSGLRRVDVLTKTGRAIESKVGRTSLTDFTRSQIEKDMYLRDTQGLSPEWYFTRSGVTGKIGPTGPLAQFLDKAGIPWFEEP